MKMKVRLIGKVENLIDVSLQFSNRTAEKATVTAVWDVSKEEARHWKVGEYYELELVK